MPSPVKPTLCKFVREASIRVFCLYYMYLEYCAPLLQISFIEKPGKSKIMEKRN